MSVTISPERLDRSERIELRPRQEEPDFVAMYGLANAPMAGKRPPRQSNSKTTPQAPAVVSDC
jgi:hypothetical protein